MSADEQSIKLLQRYRDGDEQAAQELFERYVSRLVSLARVRLSDRMKRRVEPEDVVQSVYRSFFRKAGEGRFAIDKSGDLWRLLAKITILKVRGQVEFHTAQKRGIYSETAEEISGTSVPPEALARDPSPEDAATMMEELEAVMNRLDPTQRKIMELKLQNLGEEEICNQVQRSARTVRRTLQQIRTELAGQLG